MVPVDYVDRAEKTVRRVSAHWDQTGWDLSPLLDSVCSRLASDANEELRQVLTTLSGRLQLLRHQLVGGDRATALTDLDDLLRTVDRAASVVSTHLDRNEAAKLLIRLDPEPLDIESTLRRLGQQEARTSGVETRFDTEPVSIEADRTKTRDVLSHLLARAARSNVPGGSLVIRLQASSDGCEGFIGCSPPHATVEDLIEELDRPLDLAEHGVDIPFTRAVLERHGGTLVVDQPDEDTTGYTFTLPRTPQGALP